MSRGSVLLCCCNIAPPYPCILLACKGERRNEVLTQFGESTAINYRTHVKKHLVPFFGGCALRDITPELVQRFVSASSVGPKTTSNICITLQSLWRTAKAWGYVTLPNIMESVVLPPVKRVQRFFFSGAELGRILETALEPYRTFYGLLAETGVRVGEP